MEGIEFEARALLSENFSMTATATHIETTEISDKALAVINGADFAIENGLEPYQVYGGRIAGDRSTFVGTGVELDRGGLPDNSVSLYLNYFQEIDNGKITASTGFGWADETYSVTNVRISSEGGASGNVVHITKSNATGVAIGGDSGGSNWDPVYLKSSNSGDVNQQWIEIDRGGGYYSYQKYCSFHLIYTHLHKAYQL